MKSRETMSVLFDGSWVMGHRGRGSMSCLLVDDHKTDERDATPRRRDATDERREVRERVRVSVTRRVIILLSHSLVVVCLSHRDVQSVTSRTKSFFAP